MRLKLEDMYAYRFFDKSKGPLDTIRIYTEEELEQIGRDEGITDIQGIYHNRVNMENLMLSLFKQKGGNPRITYPYYFAVYDDLPESCKLHVRFKEPICLKIPMCIFEKQYVSFTYGLSTHAFTRKDNHPCRRKLLTWDEAESVINEFPFDENEDIWMEMQLWDRDFLKSYYEYDEKVMFELQVRERLSEQEKDKLKEKYKSALSLIKPEYFFEPSGVHGISHAQRVLILAQELAENHLLDDYYKKVLFYSAVYHDIGREHNFSDKSHGYKSFQKVKKHSLMPCDFSLEQKNLLRFIIENHPFDVNVAKNNINAYSIDNKEKAIITFCIFRDADILDRCRYGNVNKHYLYYKGSKLMVPFAFQLLLIFKERF